MQDDEAVREELAQSAEMAVVLRDRNGLICCGGRGNGRWGGTAERIDYTTSESTRIKGGVRIWVESVSGVDRGLWRLGLLLDLGVG